MTTVRTDQVTLDDGAMDLHLWIPDAGSGPGLLLIQEIFGVGAYVRAVAERLVDAGYTVGAPDVFWRFAPGWEAGHDQEGLAASMAQVANLDPPKGDRRLRRRPRPPRRGRRRRPLGRHRVLPRRHARLRRRRSLDDPSVCVSYYGSGSRT